MKNNIENIPTEVFDWLASKSFEQLDSQQKQIVLQYFSIEEYHDFANSTHEINSIMRPNQNERIPTKERLLNKFDEVNAIRRKRFITPGFLRYAAVVILSIGLGYQLRFWLQPTKTNQVVFQPIVDTVYVNKEIDVVNAADMEVKDSIHAKTISSSGSEVKREYVTTKVPDKQMKLNFNVVSIQDAKKIANIPKGNNCKSDSLRKKFVYVSL